jgi:hypothetical protein
MKICTFYSDSHSKLIEMSIKTFLKHCSSDILIKKIKQTCSGDYHSEGWNSAMIQKLDYIIECLKNSIDQEIVVHSDCDILYFKNCENIIKEELNDNDIIFQWDSSGVCMGFFAAKNSKRVIDFFEKIRTDLHLHQDDQFCANAVISSTEFSDLKIAIFSNKFFTIGMNNKQNDQIYLPKDISIFHANFVPNLKTKTLLMETVYDYCMSNNIDNLIPFPPKYPLYPPYSNVNDYIEHYFYNFYLKNKDEFKSKSRIYIPAFWTTIYNDNLDIDVQSILNSLPEENKYFTVIQHDDGIKYRLPKNTIVFSASENGSGEIIPIPLITSPIPHKPAKFKKSILCSFVGSNTHWIRQKLFDKFSSTDGFVFKMKPWSPNINSSDLQEFVDITCKSKFSLAPRGNIRSSFRLYEILQLGSVPVYISDEFFLPFSNEINWSKFCILIHPNDIDKLNDILNSISDSEYEQMILEGSLIYNNYFTLDKVCEKIHSLL